MVKTHKRVRIPHNANMAAPDCLPPCGAALLPRESHRTFNKTHILSNINKFLFIITSKNVSETSLSWLVFSGTEYLVEVSDKLSSMFVDFFKSERELENMALTWSLKCLLSMLRGMLGSVKSENSKGEGEIGKWKIKE